MSRRLIECVANFSEGRRPEVVDELCAGVSWVPGAHLLRREQDPDHNRAVLTMAGAPEPVCEAAFRSVARAVELIDLRCQQGVHPRVGAADVVPLIPLDNVTMEECVRMAHALGRRIWEELNLPVYFYEHAALRPDRRRLEVIRKGGYEALRRQVLTDPARAPDIGGPHLHESAGAVVVGARHILVAFNILLATPEVDIAAAIARRIRASSGGFPGVKALGVHLASRGLAQVTMNLTDYRTAPPLLVFETVEQEAARHGTAIVSSEIVGLAPRGALPPGSAERMRIENFHPGLILEDRLAALE